MTIAPPRNLLVSFAYYHKYDLDRLAPCRIAADSGAVSLRTLGKPVETRNLVTWAQMYHHRISWIASLDITGNAETSKYNWNEMVDAGIPGVPTIHLRERPETMDYYVERGVDFIGLGGMALVDAGIQEKFRWMVACFKYARDNHPHVRFHGWGLANKSHLRLPFFSVDSSGWGSSYRYGRLHLRDPQRQGKVHSIDLNGRGTYSQDIACLLRDHYGVNPSEVSTSAPHNRLMMVRLSALSASVQEQQLRYFHRRNPVPSPKWGRLGGWSEDFTGPILYLVDGHPQHIETVAKLARGEQVYS